MIDVGISAIDRPYPVGVNLQVGSKVYVDRGYTYTHVPSLVQGGSYIQTANNDKAQNGNPFLTFTLDKPSLVYVAHDVRITSKPSWLSAFADTVESLVTSDTTLQLFKKPYPAGLVELGDNGYSGVGSMYVVAIQPAPMEEPVPKPTDGTSYPKIMAMAIRRPTFYFEPAYQAQIAKADVGVMGFYRGWYGGGVSTPREVVLNIKAMNPDILLAQYTILNEAADETSTNDARPDVGQKITAENWWVKNAAGEKVQWTEAYAKFDVNMTAFAQKDAQGKRYPEWLAELNHFDLFRPIPEFDICYLDNSLSKPASPVADWDNDGVDEANTDKDIAEAYRKGHVAHWEATRKLNPHLRLLGNSDNLSSPEYSGQLEGGFFEAAIGKSWSVEAVYGWDEMMRRYRSHMAHTKDPHLVGFNVWGSADDYQRMRYGLCSCLLDDGYYSYTDEVEGYGSVPWFDEFDADLGRPVEPPAMTPIRGTKWYKREFERGLVVVNAGSTASAWQPGPGYKRIAGTQDPSVNNGANVGWVNLASKDGILLLKV